MKRDETSPRGPGPRQARGRLSVLGLMTLVLMSALILGASVSFTRWLLNPHIAVHVFNETGKPIHDICVSYGERKREAKTLLPGQIASSDIRCAGEDGIDFSYRDLGEGLKVSRGLCYIESGYRGSLEIHVKPTGLKLVDRIALGPYPPRWVIPVEPEDKMKVR
jgi:hypothetical protein